MNLLAALRSVFSISNDSTEPTGADAIVVDYYERQNMVPDGKETTGVLIDADRVVDEGVFQSNAVAHLTFSLGKYGTYPLTLELPEGPGDDNELEDFMDRVGVDVEDLPHLVNGPATFPFVRSEGEWKINWDELDVDVE